MLHYPATKYLRNDPKSDGEIVCVDESGRSIFKDVLFSRGERRFLAFDVLCLDVEDFRSLPL